MSTDDGAAQTAALRAVAFLLTDATVEGDGDAAFVSIGGARTAPYGGRAFLGSMAYLVAGVWHLQTDRTSWVSEMLTAASPAADVAVWIRSKVASA